MGEFDLRFVDDYKQAIALEQIESIDRRLEVLTAKLGSCARSGWSGLRDKGRRELLEHQIAGYHQERLAWQLSQLNNSAELSATDAADDYVLADERISEPAV